VVVAVEAGKDRLVFGEPTPLFEAPLPHLNFGFGFYTSPFPDAQRFLRIKPAEEEIPQPLTLVVNWTAELDP